ncbi:hypothetical protein CEE69_05865 [Rhodopirellula bahusiensis]|uniref:Uncharacterized protein n=1 Tax=Rhodopirellula bahusiensis TaxID=2014065 RepID=A0A2G1WAW9_9BACT|nr:hypothetical protein CEE69_05865 [Rhodopirellula bahusiensis]
MPPPSRTPGRRRLTSPKTSFRERFSNAETRQNAAPENGTAQYERKILPKEGGFRGLGRG